jgi:aminoglycoside phosphotransferase (APT) family kinase protein
LSGALALVPIVLGQLADYSGALAGWSVLDASWTLTGTATVLVGLAGGSPRAVLRMSSTGADRLRHESAVLQALAAFSAPGGGGLPVTRRRGDGAVEDWYFVLDDYVEGLDAPVALSTNPSLRPAVERAGVAAATALHRATARPVTVDDELLRRWVDEPVEVLARELRRSSLKMARGRLPLLRERLHRSLGGQDMQAGWIHGDFWWGNIRVDPDTGDATGVVDWDCAGPDELPAHDLLHLALYAESLRRRVSLGRVVADAVGNGTWPAECEQLIRHARWAWPEQVPDADVALLYWLRYTAMMIAQQRDYVDHSILVWEWRNVVPVLRSIGRDGDRVEPRGPRRRARPEASAPGGVPLEEPGAR